MAQAPMHATTDVLVIGSGAAGMYAAIEAARGGAQVLLADRSLIGRGGATVMAQMTVAVALGAETDDHWSHHYQDTLKAGGYTGSELVDGSFLCPDSTLTDFLLRRKSRSKEGSTEGASIVRIEPSPATMFSDLPPAHLIGMLARQDRLPVTPRENLLSALYYFRVACACFYLWQEQHLPLFTTLAPPALEPGVISADVARRAVPGKSAYSIMLELVDEAELVQRSRQAVGNVASLPLRMAEIRSLLQSVGREDDKYALRQLRKELEIEFRNQLHGRIGDISADDPRPIGDILDDVATASRNLRDHMREFAVNRAQNLQAAPGVT